MISVFFVLSSIGEVIVFKDFRQQFTRTVTEDFIEMIKKKGVSRIPPVLVIGQFKPLGFTYCLHLGNCFLYHLTALFLIRCCRPKENIPVRASSCFSEACRSAKLSLVVSCNLYVNTVHSVNGECVALRAPHKKVDVRS